MRINDDIIYGLCIVAEQCEEAGRIQAAQLIDKALAMLDPNSVTRVTPFDTLAQDLLRTYETQESSSEDIIVQIDASVAHAQETLTKLREALRERRSLEMASKMQALAFVIGSVEVDPCK